MATKFNCPQCGKKIIFQYLKAGEKAKCFSCNAEVIVPDDTIETDEAPSRETQEAPLKAELKESYLFGRFQKLDNLLITIKVFAWIMAILYALAGFIAFASFAASGQYSGAGLIAGLMFLVISVMMLVFTYVGVEAVKVLVSVEKNTFEMRNLLEIFKDKLK